MNFKIYLPIIFILILSLGYTPTFAQCNPAQIEYTLKEGASPNIIEVYLRSDIDVNNTFVTQSAQIGIMITLPPGESWSGNRNTDLNINSNFNNGDWGFSSFYPQPSCGTGNYDYLYASLNSQWGGPTNLFSLLANTEYHLFTFTLPGDCADYTAPTLLIDHNDPFIVGGCIAHNITNNITLLSSGGASCNNYLRNYNNTGVCPIPALLPVEYLHFRATPDKKQTYLEWATSSEENNKGFEVQRSRNGDTWEVLGWVDGHGTTAEENAYMLVDKRPYLDANYYRLKQVDFDGRYSYSDIRVVYFTEITSDVILYPNPVKNLLHIQLPDEVRGEVTLTVVDVEKKAIKEKIIEARGELVHLIQVGDLVPGSYYLKISSRYFEEYHRFIKIRL